MKSLSFPSARLYIHDLLVGNGLTGAQAIQQGAREFGVFEDGGNPEEIELVGIPERDLTDCCECCQAAYKVLQQFFSKRSSTTRALDMETAWKSFRNRLNYYRAGMSSGKARPLNCQLACSNLAPVIFDLLLQEVHRYS